MSLRLFCLRFDESFSCLLLAVLFSACETNTFRAFYLHSTWGKKNYWQLQSNRFPFFSLSPVVYLFDIRNNQGGMMYFSVSENLWIMTFKQLENCLCFRVFYIALAWDNFNIFYSRRTWGKTKQNNNNNSDYANNSLSRLRH